MNQNTEVNFPFTIGIIGVGQLGSSLIEALTNKATITCIVARSDDSYNKANQYHLTNTKIYRTVAEIDVLPQLTLLAVSDNSITEVANEFCKYFKGKFHNHHFIHFSGIYDNSILKELKKDGALCSGTHPYQTLYFTNKNNFKEAVFGVESNYDLIFDFVKLLGGNPFALSSEMLKMKAVYHCSAVVASNILSSVIYFARLLADKAGIPAELFIPPIVKKTIENNIEAFSHTNSFPLSGPLARQDIKTLKLHIDSLSNDELIKQSYAYFSLAAAGMALHNGILSRDGYESICEMLSKENIKASKK